MCLKSAQEVWVMRASLLNEFQSPGSMGQTMGQEQCRMLAIVCKMLAIVCRVGLERKEVHWPNGKEASGLGKNIMIQLSFRIALTSCICLISKVPGHDPVWWEFCCENLDHSHYGKRCCLTVERFLQSAICYRPAILPLTALKKIKNKFRVHA